MYLLFAIFFSLYWIVLFLSRRDLHHAMFFMGGILVIAGLIGQYFLWTHDWWSPQTVTDTVIGVEDVIHGFTMGGIAFAAYPVIFRKKLIKAKQQGHTNLAILMILLSIGGSLILFWLGDFSSVYVTFLVATILYCTLMFQRPDLLKDSIISGVLLALFAFPVFISMHLIYPDFLRTTWQFENLSGVVILYSPLEDIIFYFFTGLLTPTLYLYLKGFRFGS